MNQHNEQLDHFATPYRDKHLTAFYQPERNQRAYPNTNHPPFDHNHGQRKTNSFQKHTLANPAEWGHIQSGYPRLMSQRLWCLKAESWQEKLFHTETRTALRND
ncbi:hypothetical protein YC2023_107254 [Brassica napus]